MNTFLEAVGGDDLYVKIEVERDGEALNIAGATFQIVGKFWASDASYVFNSTDFDILDAATGQAIIRVPGTDTEEIEDKVEVNFRVRMIEANGDRTTVDYGLIKFHAG